MTNLLKDRNIERMEQEWIQENIIYPRLKNQLSYVISESSFYRRKLKRFGSNGSELISHFETLPFTEKCEIISDQDYAPPFGTNIAVPPYHLMRVHRTSGTTARPVFLALTANDIATIVDSGRRCFFASGLLPEHTVIHCLNYCLWMGGYTDHQSLEATGATVIPYGVGNSRGLIDAIMYLKPHAIHCTPSYLSKLELLLREGYNKEPRDLCLSLGLFGGEAGLQDPSFRARIEKVWGLRAMNANYGLSDVHSMFGAECNLRCGLHFMAQEYLLPEIIDPNDGTVLPMERGSTGELVLTHLMREAQPLIRFRTHDIITIIDTNPCVCGRTSFRFMVNGRSDDMLVIRGLNIYPEAVGKVLLDFSDVLSREFQILVEGSGPIEKMILRIELKELISEDHESQLTKELGNHLKAKFNLNINIELLCPGSLPRSDGKTKRVFRI